MSVDFIPAREADLVSFTNNMATLLGDVPAQFGLDTDQGDAYVALNTQWVNAYNLTQNGLTRSRSNIISKNELKKQIVALTRQYARIMNAWPDMTNAKRAQLGLTVREPEPTPVPAPTTAPKIDVMGVYGRTLFLNLSDPGSDRRGKPDKVQHAVVFSYVGTTPPPSLDGWTFEANVTRTTTQVTFDADLPPGATVYVTAMWQNFRAESGPMATPAMVTFGAAGVGVPKAA